MPYIVRKTPDEKINNIPDNFSVAFPLVDEYEEEIPKKKQRRSSSAYLDPSHTELECTKEKSVYSNHISHEDSKDDGKKANRESSENICVRDKTCPEDVARGRFNLVWTTIKFLPCFILNLVVL